MQTEEDAEKATFASDSRTVNLAGGAPADKTAGFAKNNIKTAKYNLITFFPIFLFEMFSRAAYLYFLAQVVQCCNHWRCLSQLWSSFHLLLAPQHVPPTHKSYLPCHVCPCTCCAVQLERFLELCAKVVGKALTRN